MINGDKVTKKKCATDILCIVFYKQTKISLFSKYYQQYSHPMGHGTKEYEDVPDGMVMAFAVVCKEVGANSI